MKASKANLMVVLCGVRRRSEVSGGVDCRSRLRGPFLNEVVFAIEASLGVAFGHGDDLGAPGQEMRTFVTKAVDHIAEAEAAVLDDGRSFRNVSPRSQVLKDSTEAGLAQIRETRL
jgi:hypothetical protein